MKKERLAFLFDKYVADSIDASELAELEHYMGTTDDEYLRDLIAIKMQGSAASEEQIDIESIIVQLEKNVWSRINPPVQKLWLRIMKVAAILLACLMPLMIFKIQQDSERKFHVIPASNVLGGSKQAILTLDDGTKIGLAESGAGMIAEQHGIKILKTADGQIHYEIASLPSGDGKAQGERYHLISTPKGGECMVHLSDGSKVWLNAASSLRYAAEVSRSGQRLVKLTGEAYFEVASDASRPFIVQTDRQRIRVLGTHFNVSSYTDEAMVTTTLLEGSVSVANNQGKQVLIKPGEAALSKGDMLTTEQADIELALAWKNGELQFKRQDLRSIMKVIARWYDVELSFEGDVPPREFTGRIKRASNLGVVLKIFEASNIKFELREDNLGKKTLIIKS